MDEVKHKLYQPEYDETREIRGKTHLHIAMKLKAISGDAITLPRMASIPFAENRENVMIGTFHHLSVHQCFERKKKYS